MRLSSAQHRGFGLVLVVVLALAILTPPGLAQERERSQVPDRYKWDLRGLYPSHDVWRTAMENITAGSVLLGLFQSRLGGSAETLADALDLRNGLDQQLLRLSAYATMWADQDMRDPTHEGMRQEIVQLRAAFDARASYIGPEILRIGGGTIQKFLATEPRLEPYRFYLEDIARRAPHTLGVGEERILAAAAPVTGASSSVYSILSNVDFPYPAVTLSTGESVTVTPATFERYRGSVNREDRRKVMSAFFGSLGAFSRTFGATMNGSVQMVLFFSRARRYRSSLEMALDDANIPLTVHTRLIDVVGRNLATFHRYLGLRKRMMGLDVLHYYDLYAPLVPSVNLQYTPQQAEEHILAAFSPLGRDYVSIVERAFDERWIDWFPTTGKRPGAYTLGGAYEVHPYILMNYNGKYDDLSTLAHELGHALHSYHSNKTQPYSKAAYPTFVAEVASTFNESLLIHHMLATIRDDSARLSLLGNYLENIKATVFRQTQFAEFELRIHDMARSGEPLTGDSLSKLYLEITRKYYGHDRGVSVVDDWVAHEWSFVPHFYNDFYVFQYATSFAASEALAQKVLSGEPGATTRYFTFLSAGGSKYPIDLLKDAGVDMTTDEPLELTIKEMNRVMDEMERLLDRSRSAAAR
jgi:oligoendopeptidase F